MIDELSLSNKALEYLANNNKKKATEFIADEFKKINHIYTIRDDKFIEMWIYSEGIYIPQGKTYVKEFCRTILKGAYNTNICNQVIAKIEVDTYIDSDLFFQEEKPNIIAVQNGLLNVDTRTLFDFNPKYKFFSKLPIIYDVEKDCPNIKKFFKSILKEELEIKVIQEVFGFLLYRDYFLEKAFMFLGSGRNGKGKTLTIMKTFLGVHNCVEIPLEDMEKDMYSVGELFKKLANLCGDLSKTALNNTGVFKKLCGRDLISASRKYLSRISFVNYSKLIFSANELPLTNDISDAFWDRWIILEFPFKFKEESELLELRERGEDMSNYKLRDPDILNKIINENELSGLLNWALEGLIRIKRNKEFSFSPSSTETKNKWLQHTNNCVAFVNNKFELDYDSFVTKETFRSEYQKYCQDNGLTMSSNQKIKNILYTLFGVSDNKVYIGEENNKIQKWVWNGIRLKN